MKDCKLSGVRRDTGKCRSPAKGFRKVSHFMDEVKLGKKYFYSCHHSKACAESGNEIETYLERTVKYCKDKVRGCGGSRKGIRFRPGVSASWQRTLTHGGLEHYKSRATVSSITSQSHI